MRLLVQLVREQRIDGRLYDEITRATNEENRIDDKIDAEITRATRTEQALNSRADTLNDEIDAEESKFRPKPKRAGNNIGEDISPAPVPKKRKNISIKSLNRGSAWEIESKEDVEKYISELKEKLLDEIREDTIIHIEF